MKNLCLSLAVFLIAPLSFVQAGVSDHSSYACQVKNYDKDFVELSCASWDQPMVMRTPASWFPTDQKITRDAKIKLDLTFQQVQQWPSFNKTAKARK